MSKNYAEMNKTELVNICKEKGINAKGSKTDLIARLNLTPENTETKTESVPVSMHDTVLKLKQALITMYDVHGNKKAMSWDIANTIGIDRDDFDRWVRHCAELRETLEAYVKVKHSAVSTKEEREAAKNRCYPLWRKILKDGAEKELHKNMFIYVEDDLHSLVGYVERFIYIDGHAVQSVHNKVQFRRKVETLIGFRMSGNEMIGSDDADILRQYNTACRIRENANRKLEGYTKGEDVIPSLDGQVTALEIKCEEAKADLKAKAPMLTDEVIAEFEHIKAFATKIADLKNQRTQAEKSLKKAEETIAKYETKALEIKSRVKKIEA